MVQAVQFRGSLSGEVIQTNFTLPNIKANEVLIKVTHSGICASDIHQLHKPLVLGHEGECDFTRTYLYLCIVLLTNYLQVLA